MTTNKSITLKAVLIGMITCIALSFLEPYGTMVVGGSNLCADFSTGGALFLLFILVLVINSSWRFIHFKTSLSSGELIVIYIMMVIACSIVSHGFVLLLLGLLAGIKYYATPTNSWSELIHPHIPSWMVPQGEEVIRTFYEGLSKGARIPWAAWITPLASWTIFILAAYFLMICLMVVFRKSWVEEERLLFPLTQVPLALTEQAPSGLVPVLFKNKLFWIGILVPFSFYSIKALHSYCYFIPDINFDWDTQIMRGAGSIRLRLYFEVIGIAYLLSQDVSLGLWFFSLYATFLTAFCNMLGHSIGPVEPGSAPISPIVSHQVHGALMVLVISLIWRNRHNIKGIFKKALGMDEKIDDSKEMLSYRTVFWGSIIALGIMIFFLVKAGMPLLTAIVFIFVTYIILIGLTRVVAQGGIAYGRPPVFPFVVTLDALGSHTIGPSGLTMLGMQSSWAADTRTFVMASTANSLKMAEKKTINQRRLFWIIGLAILVTLIGTYITGLNIAYKGGGLNEMHGWYYKGSPKVWGALIQNKIIHPSGIEYKKLFFQVIGAGLMVGFIWLRNHLLWWPIHPLGLAIGSSFPLQMTWLSIFLGWLTKFFILRFGGAKLYRKLLPFFFGLILGTFVAAGVWLIIDSFTGMTGNRFTLG